MPFREVNGAIDAGVKAVYAALGADDDASIVTWAWNSEDLAGNPLHLALIGVTCAALVVVPRTRLPYVIELTALPLVSTLLTVLLIPPATTIVGVRLQMPLFVLWARSSPPSATLHRVPSSPALILVLLASLAASNTPFAIACGQR
jgi:hypothetical protein